MITLLKRITPNYVIEHLEHGKKVINLLKMRIKNDFSTN